MKRCYLLAATTCWWVFTSLPAWTANETPPVTKEPKAVEAKPAADEDGAGVPDPDKDLRRAKELAAQFGVTEQQVLGMRQTTRMGWGEIRNLLVIAQAVSAGSAGGAAPLTMDQALAKVLEQRASGMGIGQIAGSHNLKLGPLDKPEGMGTKDRPEHPAAVGRPDKPAKPDRPEKSPKPDKPMKPEKPEKPDRPDHAGRRT